MQVKSVTNATYIIYLFLHFFVELYHTDLCDVHNIVRHICLSALHVDIVDERGGGGTVMPRFSPTALAEASHHRPSSGFYQTAFSGCHKILNT